MIKEILSNPKSNIELSMKANKIVLVFFNKYKYGIIKYIINDILLFNKKYRNIRIFRRK